MKKKELFVIKGWYQLNHQHKFDLDLKKNESYENEIHSSPNHFFQIKTSKNFDGSTWKLFIVTLTGKFHTNQI